MTYDDPLRLRSRVIASDGPARLVRYSRPADLRFGVGATQRLELLNAGYGTLLVDKIELRWEDGKPRDLFSVPALQLAYQDCCPILGGLSRAEYAPKAAQQRLSGFGDSRPHELTVYTFGYIGDHILKVRVAWGFPVEDQEGFFILDGVTPYQDRALQAQFPWIVQP